MTRRYYLVEYVFLLNYNMLRSLGVLPLRVARSSTQFSCLKGQPSGD